MNKEENFMDSQKGPKAPKTWFIVCVQNNIMPQRGMQLLFYSIIFYMPTINTMAGSFFKKKSHNSWVWGWKQTFSTVLAIVSMQNESGLDVSWQLPEKQLQKCNKYQNCK